MMAQNNEPTIEQMDITIARFMGMEGSDEFIRQNYQYHKSWELLMPVVEKIRDLVRKEKEMGEIKLLPRWVPIRNELCNVNITNVHYCVYQFITWLNQQKQTNEHDEETKTGNR